MSPPKPSSTALLRVFSGVWRGLGEPSTGEEVYSLQLSLDIRKVIHLFTPSEFMLLVVLATHMKSNGKCFPGWDTLMAETGFKSRGTLSTALSGLCAKRIRGRTVLLRWRERDPNTKQFTTGNQYVLFPSKEQIAYVAEVERVSTEATVRKSYSGSTVRKSYSGNLLGKSKDKATVRKSYLNKDLNALKDKGIKKKSSSSFAIKNKEFSVMLERIGFIGDGKNILPAYHSNPALVRSWFWHLVNRDKDREHRAANFVMGIKSGRMAPDANDLVLYDGKRTRRCDVPVRAA